MKKIRILIADDHKLMRMGLISFISGKRDMECVGEARNGELAVELCRKLSPDVVIMDLMMPKLNGAEATKRILAAQPDTKIVVLTSYGTSKELSEAILNGATGVLMKDVETSKLVSVIREVAAGRTAIPEKYLQMSQEESATPQLTEHQLKILSSIAIGRTNADIAKEFDIAESTVKNLVSAIFLKIGAANRAEAVTIALRKHLVDV